MMKEEGTMLHSTRGCRRGAWQALDALVLEEVEALIARQRPPDPQRPDAAARHDLDPEAEAENRDEEAFIDRSVEFLRGRPDAVALLDAVRAALAEAEGEVLPQMGPDAARNGDDAPEGLPGEPPETESGEAGHRQ
jgi:hypothetical protein